MSDQVAELKEYLERSFLNQPVLDALESMKINKKSSAGSRREEIFTREFLMPCIRDYFLKEKCMSFDDVKNGLGQEGFKNTDYMSFTPAGKKFIFTKSIFKENLRITKNRFLKDIPQGWLKNDNVKLSQYRPCPDFATRHPLPSILGECKYFNERSSYKNVVKQFYEVSREMILYSAANNGVYEKHLIVLVDGSKKRVVEAGLNMFRDELFSRFEECNFYIAALELS